MDGAEAGACIACMDVCDHVYMAVKNVTSNSMERGLHFVFSFSFGLTIHRTDVRTHACRVRAQVVTAPRRVRYPRCVDSGSGFSCGCKSVCMYIRIRSA